MSDRIWKRIVPVSLALFLAVNLILPAFGSVPEAETVPAEAILEQKTAATLYQIGVMWMNGDGIKQDISLGRYWVHLAARHGYPLAQYNLGVMYFDGIGGEYNRPCAQWWLNRAAEQDEPEVRLMAEEALQSVLPEIAILPKVYRPADTEECDRLPGWHSEHIYMTEERAVLPPGDIDTERMAIVQTPPVTIQTAEVEEQAATRPVPEMTEIEAAGHIVTETADTRVQDFSEESTAKPVSAGDSGVSVDSVSAGEILEPETDKKADAKIRTSLVAEVNEQSKKTAELPDALVSIDIDSGGNNKEIMSADPEMTTSASDVESVRTSGETTRSQEEVIKPVSGGAENGADISSDAAPKKTKILKPSANKAVSALDLGGGPATAKGTHYTLQLSGGTAPDELYRTARRHKLTNYLVYETERSGQLWYVLVAGEYATLTTANQALKTLPAELHRNGPWVRSLRQVQNELQKNRAK